MNGLRMVVVDDDPILRVFLGKILTNCGHCVVAEATTGPAMVDTVLTHQPDLVLFDIHLPGINGLEALHQIYQAQVVAAVAITADRDHNLLQRALEEHVLALLIKPIEAHQIGPAIAMAWKQFEDLQALTQENATLRQTLQKRKIIERAKGALMKRHRWTEEEAFRRLQRAAMNRRTGVFEIAQEVLNGIELTL